MMKMLRYICFFLSLALLLPLIASCSDGINFKLAPVNSAVAVRTLEVDRFNIGKNRFYGFRSLSSANFEECKNVLISDMKNYRASCDVSAFMIKTDQFADIFVELLNENPDLFYVSQSFSYNYDQNEYVKKVFLTYTLAIWMLLFLCSRRDWTITEKHFGFMIIYVLISDMIILLREATRTICSNMDAEYVRLIPTYLCLS